MSELRCPCGGRAFDAPIEGWQENLSFERDGDEVRICHADSVHVTDHDSDHLVCRACEKAIAESDLVEVDN